MLPGIDWSAVSELFIYDPRRPLLFNSAAFFLLFLLFYGGYLLLVRRLNLRLLYLLAFSLFFYYKSSGLFFVLLLISTLIDYALGHLIWRARRPAWRRFCLWLSLAANLGLLGYFKYTNFFIDTANTLFGAGWGPADIFLPVGISFFTFQTMSYSIDVYRGHLVPVTATVRDLRSFVASLLDFAFFVSFFPQLVAGPIVRAAEFLPQIRQPMHLSDAGMGRAFLLILGGLFKKAVISDFISINFVDRVFEAPALYSGFENLLAVYGYAAQIYCDFSGYSDMAIGLGLLLGFQLPENFRHPYRADSVQDFWRRWHISLSTWLRDYLYISLGGNRHGRRRIYFNLMITMVLGGLWHGASWVFILWGTLHGVALAIDRYLRERSALFANPALRALFVLLWVHLMGWIALGWATFSGRLSPDLSRPLWENSLALGGLWLALFLLGGMLDALLRRLGAARPYPASRPVAAVMVFHFVCLCWIFFRAGALNNPAPPLQTVREMLVQLLGAFRPELALQVVSGYHRVFALLVLAYLLHFFPTHWRQGLEAVYLRTPWYVKSLSLALIIWLVIQTASADVVPFIYFQF